MGKKRRMRNYPQKFGRKYASHPYARALAKLEEIKEEAMADGVITAAEELEIAAAEAEVESLASVLNDVPEEVTPEPAVEPEPEHLVVDPEHVAEEITPEPEPVVIEPDPAPAPKRKPRAKRKPRKTTTSKKLEVPAQSE